MTTANKLTLLRVLLIPVFMVLLMTGHGWWALAVYILASVTDFVDGYIARHYNQTTDFGKFADPLADKLLVFAALVIFVERGQMPAWAVVIMLAREFAVSGLRMLAASESRVIAAAMSGKVKTFSSLVCICIMLTPLCELALGPVTLNWACVAVMVVTTIWSGVEYFVKNLDVFKA